MIEPARNIQRSGDVLGSEYFALIGDGAEGTNIAAVRYVRYNLIRIGPQGEGGPAPGGIVTGDPEDVRWFARNLLQLADLMEDAGK